MRKVIDITIKVVAEDGVVGNLFRFFLAGVQREGAEVVGLAGAYFELDAGWFLTFVLQDAITGAKEVMGVETLGNRKWLFAQDNGIHPIHGERVRFLIYPVLACEEIPAAFVLLQAEGFQEEIPRLIHLEALIVDLQHLFIPDSPDDVFQEAMAGRLAFKKQA